jgi:hypothetical protein
MAFTASQVIAREHTNCNRSARRPLKPSGYPAIPVTELLDYLALLVEMPKGRYNGQVLISEVASGMIPMRPHHDLK